MISFWRVIFLFSLCQSLNFHPDFLSILSLFSLDLQTILIFRFPGRKEGTACSLCRCWGVQGKIPTWIVLQTTNLNIAPPYFSSHFRLSSMKDNSVVTENTHMVFCLNWLGGLIIDNKNTRTTKWGKSQKTKVKRSRKRGCTVHKVRPCKQQGYPHIRQWELMSLIEVMCMCLVTWDGSGMGRKSRVRILWMTEDDIKKRDYLLLGGGKKLKKGINRPLVCWRRVANSVWWVHLVQDPKVANWPKLIKGLLAWSLSQTHTPH